MPVNLTDFIGLCWISKEKSPVSLPWLGLLLRPPHSKLKKTQKNPPKPNLFSSFYSTDCPFSLLISHVKADWKHLDWKHHLYCHLYLSPTLLLSLTAGFKGQHFMFPIVPYYSYTFSHLLKNYYYHKKMCDTKLTATSSNLLPGRQMKWQFSGLPCLLSDPQVESALSMVMVIFPASAAAQLGTASMKPAKLCQLMPAKDLDQIILTALMKANHGWWKRSINRAVSPLGRKAAFWILKAHHHEVLH